MVLCGLVSRYFFQETLPKISVKMAAGSSKLCTSLHGIITHMTEVFISPLMRTPYLTWYMGAAVGFGLLSQL